MKKIILISALAALCLGCAVSCSGILDQTQTDKIATANMWTSPELAAAGIRGLYRPFYRDETDRLSNGAQLNYHRWWKNGAYGGYCWNFSEAIGFPTDYRTGGWPLWYLSSEGKTADEFFIGYEWVWGYHLANACNDAIANLHKAGLDEATYNNYLCQARFLRAFAYKHLNERYWGVPIYEEPMSADECTKTQSSADEVWDFVLEDLTFCIENEYFPTNTIGKLTPSKGAAYALRGKVYMWLKDYEKAEKDLAKVSECGYSLYTGEFSDMWSEANETIPEKIWSIQYDRTIGYGSRVQQSVGSRDTYNAWDELKPAADFVDYFQNADGSEFKWTDYIPQWNSLTPAERSVFFYRDGLNSNPKYKDIRATAIEYCGQAAFDAYYLDSGNEARIKAAYDHRDPRLKKLCVTPYEPVDCYQPKLNGGQNMIGKQMRWPLYAQGTNGGDFWLDKRETAYYAYRKFVCFLKEDGLIDSHSSYVDYPLLRFTDVTLLRAEALIELGGGANLAAAADIINQIRSRGGMPPVSVASQEQMRQALRYERRVELCLEAQNYFDEIRWGTYKDTKFQGKTQHGCQSWWGDDTLSDQWYYDACMWPFAVPRDETMMNPNLVKTPGYIY